MCSSLIGRGQPAAGKRDSVPNVWQVEDIVFAVRGRCGSVQCRHVHRGKTSDVKFEGERSVLVCYITVGWVCLARSSPPDQDSHPAPRMFERRKQNICSPDENKTFSRGRVPPVSLCYLKKRNCAIVTIKQREWHNYWNLVIVLSA